MRCSSKQQEGEGVVHSIEQQGVQQARSLVVCEKEKNCAYACSHQARSVNSMCQGACICWLFFRSHTMSWGVQAHLARLGAAKLQQVLEVKVSRTGSSGVLQ